MALIRGANTRPELMLRRVLHSLGLRYRLHGRGLPGRPDIVLAKFGTVIFVHGCFWHRHHGCQVASTPKSNVEFWREKFRRNVERDAHNTRMLRKLGWHVIVAWECQVSTSAKATATGRRIWRRLQRILASD
jgi:DNA mismatch endonuclease (patch repair protein)